MTKRKINVFGHDMYLLGTDEDNHKIWLQAFKWDCGWYWGGGYLEELTNNNNPEGSKDIQSHTHFDGLGKIETVESVKLENGEYKTFWSTKEVNLYDGFKNRIKKSVLTDSELWKLCDLMKSFYTLRESAEFFKNGKSNYTSIEGSIARPDMQKLCNEIIEKEIIPKVYQLLS